MFQEVRPKRVFQEILDQMKHLFKTRELTVGQRMPPERELAEQLGVSRSSLREALKVLGAIGVVESRTGGGTVISEASPENIGHLLSLVFVSGKISTFELYEARMLIEGEAAALAAERRTESDLTEMARSLETLQSSPSAEEGAAADRAFHMSLVNSTNNYVLQFVFSSIADVLNEQIHDTRSSFYVESSTVLERFQNQHWEIYNAITLRDADRARQAVREHLQYASLALQQSDVVPRT